MEKINVVIVILKRDALEEILEKLDFNRVNLVAIVSDGFETFFQVGDKQILRSPFSTIRKVIKEWKNSIWLVGGYVNGVNDLIKLKIFLTVNGVPEDNIVNLEILTQVSETWFANLRYLEENGANFFATGNEFIRTGLNLKYIPRVQADKNLARNGVSLAYEHQNLRQAYLIARYIFSRVEIGTIKFVLIGLTPDAFHCDQADNFFGLQHIFALINSDSAQADLNFNAIKEERNREFSAEAIIDWEDETKFLTDNSSVETNFRILEDYIKLCLANGARPVGVILPFAPFVRRDYNENVLRVFRDKINKLKRNYYFTCVDWFNHLSYNAFSDMNNLNLKGSLYVNSAISLKLYKENLIPLGSFCSMNYEFFNLLLRTAREKNPDNFMNELFKLTVQKIRRKPIITVCFVLYEVAMWSGDELYNYFEQDKRFKPTIFLCLRRDQYENEFIVKDFMNGVEQLKVRGLNVVVLKEEDADVPKQDIIIYLIPYLDRLPNAFKLAAVNLQTLIIHIPYALDVVLHEKIFYSQKLFLVAWKVFFTSELQREIYAQKSITGIPRGVYGGYPKMDHFFKDSSEFHFEWKMARPDAKKIVWAPHHSIPDDSLIKGATFQWNYKFMYDFAKSHPETSWVVKPHPNLVYQTIEAKIFPTIQAFEEYLQAWDDLPNAKVCTGAYYQDIFATSDGMIHDSCSFTAEYQYVDKPMIYLTRETQKFNELGEKILNVSYLVDGKDLDGIAEMIQKVIIEGKDYKASDRKVIFDEYLNYLKYNGMLASEFIYKSIADEF